MTKLALGTVQFGLNYGVSNMQGQLSSSAISDLLVYASQAGIELLDTAPVYGDAETILGQLNTRSFEVVSKVPANLPPEDIEKAFMASLAAMRRDRIYGYIFHNAADLLGPDGEARWQGLEDIRKTGRVSKIGVSIYTPQEASVLLDRYPLELVQLPLNPIDARWDTHGTLKDLQNANVEVHVRSVFLQGLLLMNNPPDSLAQWASIINGFHDWCKDTGLSPVSACLGHILAQPEINRAIIGVTQTEELAAAIDVKSCEAILPNQFRTEDPILLNPGKWPK